MKNILCDNVVRGFEARLCLNVKCLWWDSIVGVRASFLPGPGGVMSDVIVMEIV